MTTHVRRRPVLGFFAGLVFGLGLALLLFVLAVVPTTAMWLGSIVGGCALLGLGAARVAPVRGR
jgi:hypothetical protein